MWAMYRLEVSTSPQLAGWRAGVEAKPCSSSRVNAQVLIHVAYRRANGNVGTAIGSCAPWISCFILLRKLSPDIRIGSNANTGETPIFANYIFVILQSP